MPADNTAHLHAAAQRRHEQARSRALQAIDTLRSENAHITAAGLARAAGVARSWIYTQPDIIEAIKATERARPNPALPTRGTQSSDAPWRQRLELAHDRIKELTNDNAQFRKQLVQAHGQLRAQRTVPSKTPSTTQNARSKQV